MPRYVDADNELKELCGGCEYQQECKDLPKEKRCVEYNIIANEPTADVAPVIHAHWAKREDGDFECSHCKRRALAAPTRNIEIAPSVIANWFKYCFECGAKMDEEDEK